jgi:hypothetical protein
LRLGRRRSRKLRSRQSALPEQATVLAHLRLAEATLFLDKPHPAAVLHDARTCRSGMEPAAVASAFAMNAGPKGWLPVDANGNNVADPLPTIDAAAEVLRELALHAPADGDL